MKGKRLKKVYFKPLDESNEKLVREVTLKSDQRNFIETVDECLREAKEYKQWQPVAIYHNEDVIGFAMYGSFGSNRHTWIDRIMIDQKYQGRGLGKEAMKILIKQVSEEYKVDVLYLSIIEENKVAEHLYKQIVFKYINEKDSNGKLIFKYTVH